MFRGFLETLQFATDGTLRFVHFCGGQPICFVGLARTAGADLLFASPQIFPELFGGALTAHFRLCLDRLFAALLAGFGLFIHANRISRIRADPKGPLRQSTRSWNLRLALAAKLWQ